MNIEILVTAGPGVITHHEIFQPGVIARIPALLASMPADRIVMVGKTDQEPELRHG